MNNVARAFLNATEATANAAADFFGALENQPEYVNSAGVVTSPLEAACGYTIREQTKFFWQQVYGNTDKPGEMIPGAWNNQNFKWAKLNYLTDAENQMLDRRRQVIDEIGGEPRGTEEQITEQLIQQDTLFATAYMKHANALETFNFFHALYRMWADTYEAFYGEEYKHTVSMDNRPHMADAKQAASSTKSLAMEIFKRKQQ